MLETFGWIVAFATLLFALNWAVDDWRKDGKD
jgi:hypothetical protein